MSSHAYLSPLTSHLSPLTSHLPPLTSHLSPLTSHLPFLTSHLSPPTSHLPPLTSYILQLTSTSYIVHRTSYILHLLQAGQYESTVREGQAQLEAEIARRSCERRLGRRRAHIEQMTSKSARWRSTVDPAHPAAPPLCGAGFGSCASSGRTWRFRAWLHTPRRRLCHRVPVAASGARASRIRSHRSPPLLALQVDCARRRGFQCDPAARSGV